MMIFIPRNIWEKQLIRLGGRISGWHKTRCYDVKVIPHVEYPAQSYWCKYQASRWILSWKKLKGICMESMECPRESLNEDAQKKKRHYMYIRGGQAEIATDTKSLDSRYAYYVSNADVIETNI